MLVIPLTHVCPLWESGLTILPILAGILELRVTVRDIRYVILFLCPRGVKLRKVGNPTVAHEQHKMTSSIFALYIISATKFV